jgi:hypothetical protein
MQNGTLVRYKYEYRFINNFLHSTTSVTDVSLFVYQCTKTHIDANESRQLNL